MGQALYRKHRPKSLAEVVGQEHITTTLSNTLKNGRISHAYLLSGPRGVGKTSIARILAHEVNQLPYDESATQLAIIEIDAASNRGIEEIRSLREKVHTAPTSGRYKVYIIDEVHMLTTPAFNALLKILEEPPAHVIFILATTEARKLPDTIISRCVRFTFHAIDEQRVTAHLKNIAAQEKIQISDDALQLIARHGEGSFRDSISLLDQVSNTAEAVALDDVLQLLGIAPDAVVEGLLQATLTGDMRALLEQLAAAVQHGYHASGLAKQLGKTVRRQLLDNRLSLTHTQATNLLHQLLTVPASHDPAALLEISLLDICLAQNHTQTPRSTTTDTIIEPLKSIKKPATESPLKQVPKPSPPKARVVANQESTEFWPQVLEIIRQRYNTLYGVLRMAKPELQAGTLTLYFAFEFHRKKFNEPKNKQILRDIVAKLSGEELTITYAIAKPIKRPTPELSPSDIGTISNIFGGAEVLE